MPSTPRVRHVMCTSVLLTTWLLRGDYDLDGDMTMAACLHLTISCVDWVGAAFDALPWLLLFDTWGGMTAPYETFGPDAERYRGAMKGMGLDSTAEPGDRCMECCTGDWSTACLGWLLTDWWTSCDTVC